MAMRYPRPAAGSDTAESRPYTFEKALDIGTLLKTERDLQRIADILVSGTYEDFDLYMKDSLDKFLDFIIEKAGTGIPEIINLAYPTKRIADGEMEAKIIRLLNEFLFPDIVLKILKYMTRNIHDSDTNLHLAVLITSDDIIRSIYETFLLFRRDIGENDARRRILNVKRIQQFPPATDDSASLPLDAACRLRYVLEFFMTRRRVDHLYTRADLSLTGIDAS